MDAAKPVNLSHASLKSRDTRLGVAIRLVGIETQLSDELSAPRSKSGNRNVTQKHIDIAVPWPDFVSQKHATVRRAIFDRGPLPGEI
jgi:hypothetical protein